MHDNLPLSPFPHHSFIRARAPVWLLGATLDQRNRLRELARDAENARHDLKQALGTLQPIEDFALEMLRPVLAELGAGQVDPRKAVLYWTDPEAKRPAIQRTLLQAALQNFHRTEIKASAYGAGSGLFATTNHDGNPDPASLLTLPAERFAWACRALDIGGKYQQVLAAQVPARLPGAGTVVTGMASFAEKVFAAKYTAFIADACVARLSGRLDEQGEALLGHWRLAPISDMRTAAQAHRLELLGFALSRVLVFTEPASGAAGSTVVAYLPGDPAGSVTQYPDAHRFVSHLRQRLAEPAFLTFFSRFVALDRRLAFIAQVNAALAPSKWRPSHLTWTTVSINIAPFAESYRIWAQQALADAAHVAVPTVLVDHRDSFERYAHWVEVGEQLGLALTLMVGSAIPGVNLIAEAVMLGQNIYSLYEGVQAWRRGDTQGALDCLFGAVENIGFIGLGKRPSVEASQFAAALVPVISADGQVRLWRSGLEDFRAHDIPPPGSLPDPSGRYAYQGRAWVQIDGAFHEVDAGASATHAPIVHPLGEGYAPVLHGDGTGAWRADHEQPAQWDSARLIRRFTQRYDALSEQSLLQAQRLAGVSDEQLRQAHLDNRGMPAPLADLLNRRLALHQLETAIGSLREQGSPGAVAWPLVDTLRAVPGWPDNVALEFRDGAEIHTFGRADAHQRIRLEANSLIDGRWAGDLIAQLDSNAHDALLGSHTSLVPAEHAKQVFADAWANTLERQRQPLLEQLIEPALVTDTARATLRRQFPRLTGEAVEALMRGCTLNERQALEAGRMPPGLGEQAAEASRQLRLAQVCDALEEGTATTDRDRLIFGLFPRLGGWASGLRVELRERYFTGKLVQSCGAPEGRRRVIVRRGEAYQAFDHQGLELSPQTSLEHALFATLPDDLRGAAAPVIVDGGGLRRALVAHALEHRNDLRRLLGMVEDNRRFFRPPTRHANGGIGYALSGRGEPAGFPRMAAVMNRIGLLALFPDISEAELAELEAELGQGEAATTSLARLNADLARLRLELDQWVARAGDHAVENAPLNEAEHRAVFAQRLVDLWQRRQNCRTPNNQGYALALRNLPVTDLPPLNVRFTHARRVALLDMNLAHVNGDFLAAFPNLTWLDLSMNALIELPNLGHLTRLERLSLDYTGYRPVSAVLDTITPLTATLEHLDLAGSQVTLNAVDFQRLSAFGRLRTLDLESNAITLSAETVGGFDQLTALENLSLNFNPLQQAPVVAHLTELRFLELSNTELRELPPGLLDLMDHEPLRLHEVNLSDNQIDNLPELTNTRFVQRIRGEVQNLDSPYYGMGLNLDGNPLQPQAQQMLRDAGLGFFEQGPGSASVDLSDESLPGHGDQWLQDCPAPLRAAIMAERNNHEASEFYQLLSRVVDTDDYRTAPEETRQRVWALVQTWLQPDEQALPGLEALRDRLFGMAQDVMGTCGDGVALTLDEMEFEVESWRILARSQAAGDGPLLELLEFQRRLWRRVLVDDIARRIVRAREARRLALQEGDPTAAPALDPLDRIDDALLDEGIDEVEVRFHLIQRLEERLALPPSRGMRYTTRVSTQTVTAVGTEVLSRDTPDAFAQWVAHRPGFRTYLEHAHQQRFNPIRERWQATADYLYTVTAEVPDPVPARPRELDTLPSAIPGLQWPEQGLPRLNDQQIRLAYGWISQQQQRELDALALQMTQALLGLQAP